jgi:hypothetical protein
MCAWNKFIGGHQWLPVASSSQGRGILLGNKLRHFPLALYMLKAGFWWNLHVVPALQRKPVAAIVSRAVIIKIWKYFYLVWGRFTCSQPVLHIILLFIVHARIRWQSTDHFPYFTPYFGCKIFSELSLCTKLKSGIDRGSGVHFFFQNLTVKSE